MPLIATFNGTNLPIQFSYKPYVPKKRNTVTATANAVITQSAGTTQIVHGDGFIPWRLDAGSPSEFGFFLGLYNTSAQTLYTFTGYWGDSYSVYFYTLDNPDVRGRLFDFGGMFQVICVLADYNMSTECG